MGGDAAYDRLDRPSAAPRPSASSRPTASRSRSRRASPRPRHWRGTEAGSTRTPDPLRQIAHAGEVQHRHRRLGLSMKRWPAPVQHLQRRGRLLAQNVVSQASSVRSSSGSPRPDGSGGRVRRRNRQGVRRRVPAAWRPARSPAAAPGRRTASWRYGSGRPDRSPDGPTSTAEQPVAGKGLSRRSGRTRPAARA